MDSLAQHTDASDSYSLDDQVGYLLRLASQRHALIFQAYISHNLTPTQFSTLVRVAEHGDVSQNHLGRLAAMDTATVKGVVDRLRQKNLLMTKPDQNDKRRSIVSLTKAGQEMIRHLHHDGAAISAATLEPLSLSEQRRLLDLLKKLV